MFEDLDGRGEVVTEGHQEVDVVEVSAATEAVSQIIAWVDRGAKLAAFEADEAEVAFELLGDGSLSSELANRDFHRQFVPNRSEEFLGDHGHDPFDWDG